ncbi:MAG: PrsW family glutamic-type intramembrane protease [bacterium]
MTALLAILAVLPALGLVVYFYVRDRYEPEPRAYVAAAFLYGALILIPALWFGRAVHGAVDREWLALSGLWGRLYEDFLVAGAVEEALKWILFMVTIARWHEFDEPMDGCVYGATMSLGLAAVENLYYVISLGTVEIAVLRGIFAVPAHALCGASMGYFVGRAKFAHRRWTLWYLVPLSLIVPWIFHGAYDHVCNYRTGAKGWVLLGLLSLAMWVFVMFAVSWALGRSPFKDGEESPQGDAEPPTGK